MPRIFPTVAEAIETHRLAIQEYVGLDGIRDKGLLESAILRPQTGYYQDIFEEAAALMESLAHNQAFVDGNKRTGALAAYVFLQINRIDFKAPEGEYEEVVLKVARGEISKAEVTDFIRKYASEKKRR